MYVKSDNLDQGANRDCEAIVRGDAVGQAVARQIIEKSTRFRMPLSLVFCSW